MKKLNAKLREKRLKDTKSTSRIIKKESGTSKAGYHGEEGEGE